MIKDIANLRRDYKKEVLNVSDTERNPIWQFKRWFEEALAADVPEPNAMTLATCGKNGRPSVRVMLLKGFDDNGFTFFTNYKSRKSREMEENPFVGLAFNWLELERQVRIEGKVEKIPFSESEAYFQSRPRGSQIGAWASPQSSVIRSRTEIEDRVAQLSKEHESVEILPCPPHWGGYLLRPDMIEFWQGRPNRLHDRIVYEKDAHGEWMKKRLAP
jgi:pyridoxamine 5'-phosphate oxidase